MSSADLLSRYDFKNTANASNNTATSAGENDELIMWERLSDSSAVLSVDDNKRLRSPNPLQNSQW
jgi:hypothetical protein